MNYQKIYNTIIEKAKSENRIKYSIYLRNKYKDNLPYYETHHIIPKCLGGTDDEENLVLLTAKEHYVCHKLLTYIYKENKKIASAFFRMTFDKRGKHEISSRDYAYAKELYYSIPMTNETKQKISLTQRGRKRSEDFKIKVSNGMKGVNVGRIHSKESKQNMSNAHIGKKLKPFTLEHKEKIRNSNKGKKHNMTPEGRERLRNAVKNRIPWNKGKKY